ncbi:MAG: DUF5655 domain-containing protein [Pseudomonadota bacterium]
MATRGLTEQQTKRFASLRDGLERETGKSMADWVKIARSRPEEKPRARRKWLKDQYGIGQNRALMIFAEAFGDRLGWDKPGDLVGALFNGAEHRNVYDRLEKAVDSFDGVAIGPRKTFVGVAKRVQFAAVKPSKDGVRLGLALDPGEDDALHPANKNEGWADRCKAVLVLQKPTDVNASAKRLLRAADENFERR